MRKPESVTVPVLVKCTSGISHDDDVPMVAERRRKSRPWLPVDDDEESDGAQADEKPLVGSKARTAGMANVDTRRRSAVVSRSRRSSIEDNEGRRRSVLVSICMLFYTFFLLSIES
jgi:hypothetical protein